jgi:hypothetical protein
MAGGEWTEATQKAYFGEGLAVGCLLDGATAIIGDRFAVESSLRRAYRGWPHRTRFPTVRTDLSHANVWALLHDSKGRTSSSVAYWEEQGTHLIPRLRQSWSLEEHAERLEGLSGIETTAWVSLADAFLDALGTRYVICSRGQAGQQDDVAQLVGELVELVESSPQDLSFAGYWSDRDDVLTDLRDHHDRLRRGDTSRLSLLKTLFNPAMPLQDMAMASGWGDRYLRLAARFDEAIRTPGRYR